MRWMVIAAAGATAAAVLAAGVTGRTLVAESVTVYGASGVTTQEVKQAQCLGGEKWGRLEALKVYVPAAETGTVTVAAWQTGGWSTLLTAACTNATAAAKVLSFDGGDALFYGPLRVLYDQSGTGTNGWGSIIFVE